ncbi:hypothetical protein KY363_05795 [Candidatus Woesearchaeota archaeon]|nr:hypothetical protein [Candidatus Woesearchaeota archaeon]
MKKAITIFLVLALVFSLGCAGKSTEPSKAVGTQAKPSASTASQAVPASTASGTTASAVSEVDTDLSGLDTLDDLSLDSELDDLDSELNFEI